MTQSHGSSVWAATGWYHLTSAPGSSQLALRRDGLLSSNHSTTCHSWQTVNRAAVTAALCCIVIPSLKVTVTTLCSRLCGRGCVCARAGWVRLMWHMLMLWRRERPSVPGQDTCRTWRTDKCPQWHLIHTHTHNAVSVTVYVLIWPHPSSHCF